MKTARPNSPIDNLGSDTPSEPQKELAEVPPRPLHLHTLDSLLADLVSGRAVLVGGGETFALTDDYARSALQWYQKQGAANWPANVTKEHGEQLVNAVQLAPLELPTFPARSATANKRRLRLVRFKAHRFAGLHKFGTPVSPPEDYVCDFPASLTLFEGRNSSGKTSLVNAILWALTGEIIRPQREPENADEEFECSIAGEKPDEEPTNHRLTPVTPMPDVDQYRPDRAWVPTDTWVELTFADENGAILPSIRRSQNRTAQGKLTETAPDLSMLGVDPVAVRIGTIMPGLLPLIKVGHESELGRAVAQLTGLSALNDLAGHAQRLKTKIDKEFIKAKTEERNQIDHRYGMAKGDLERELKPHPSLTPPKEIPVSSDDVLIEPTLDEILQHFENKKANAFDSVRNILGDTFDPTDNKRRSDLEKSIGPAISDVGQPQRLPSIARLKGFRDLTDDQISATNTKIAEILVEAKALQALAKDHSSAARARLYARVVTWMEDHPDPARDDNHCIVCGGSLIDAIDPVSGKPVKTHIHDAKTDATLLSQTLNRWAQAALGELTRSLPPSLQAELSVDLPEHPCDLIRKAIIDELFDLDSFSGELAVLKTETATAFDKAVKQRPPLTDAQPIPLPADCNALGKALKRLDLALRFVEWRRTNDKFAREIFEGILGKRPKDGEEIEHITLTGKLLELNAVVLGAEPITKALVLCGRLKAEMKLRRAVQTRLAEYRNASAALTILLKLGDLADRQVFELRNTLRSDAQKWRSRIYVSSFPSLAHELVDTSMGRKGELGLVVKTGGVSAPAQHVANASALRASLIGFFFAFWEYVLKDRGGLQTLVLDDPQELLDDENRERLAASFEHLIGAGAQLIVTSYDRRFAGAVARVPGGTVEHLAVHPATINQPVIRTTPPQTEIEARKVLYDQDRDAEEPARLFADGCRVYFESVLGDVFDDPAHSAWAKENPNPTLASFVKRLRSYVSAGPAGMFSMQVFKDFIAHSALVDNSPVLALMNKAHHGNRQEIRAGEVAECADDLAQLVKLAGRMYDECSRWKRRDAKPVQIVVALPVPLTAMPTPALNLTICPDLAAFTRRAIGLESQEMSEPFDSNLLAGKCTFYLRRPNFGFAAPQGSLAIVEATPGPVLDRRLVIARHGNSVYARRFLRSKESDTIGLTAEILDPRKRSPVTLMLPEAEVLLHQVAGVLFDHDITVAQDQDEAVLVDATRILERIEIAFRVADDSAVPLALPRQIVLGGALIGLADIGYHEEALVALTLEDGSSIFKRIGSALPGGLAHLRQFESIGGLGSSQILAVGKAQDGIMGIQSVRRIVGVIYNG